FVEQITDGKWMGNEEYLFLFNPYKKTIQLQKPGAEPYILSGCAEYAISPDSNHLAYIDNAGAVHRVTLLPKIRKTTLLKSSKQLRKNLVWKENSKALAVLEETQIPTEHKVYLIE